MPSVTALDLLMRQWGQEWAAARGFPDYFDALWRSVDAYYQSGGSGLHPSLNFEKILGEMVSLAHWMTPAPWGDTLKQVATDGSPPPRITFAYQTERYGPTVTVMDQLSYLLGKLARHVRELSRSLDTTSACATKYRKLFGELRKTFDIGVYNLNYDTAGLDALPDAYTGFSETGIFEPGMVHERAAWDFVYHLHGSVHHSLDRQFGDEIRWRRNLTNGDSFFDDPEGRSSDKRSEGRSFPRTTLIAGGFKLDQLLVEPFQSLHASLVRHVYVADAILIAGYGFGDVHINRALRSRFSQPESRPPVVVLDYACDKTDPIAFRSDLWANELCLTLHTSGSLFAEPGHSSPSVPSELAMTGGFEVAAPHRVALWYGGFVGAEQRLTSILRWLGGASDDALVPGSAT
jgi:hypothetical protein